MELEIVESGVPEMVQCPECDQKIPIDADWQENDIFSCLHCSAELQVTNLAPLLIDFAPEAEENWGETEPLEPLALEEVEELEEDVDVLDDSDSWEGPVSRRVTSLRAARPQPSEELAGYVDDQITYLTPEGVVRLRQELEYLQTERLPKVTAWLSDALSEGFEDEDVTELEEARSELSLVEGRIRKLKYLLSSAQILQEPESADHVQLGSRVTIVEGDGEPESYRIVSPAEADPLNGYISYASPLGKMLMGQTVGDDVMVQSPDGPLQFRIVNIS